MKTDYELRNLECTGTPKEITRNHKGIRISQITYNHSQIKKNENVGEKVKRAKAGMSIFVYNFERYIKHTMNVLLK